MKPTQIVIIGAPGQIGHHIERAIEMENALNTGNTAPIEVVHFVSSDERRMVCPTGIPPLDFPGMSMEFSVKQDKKELRQYSRVPPKKLRK